MGEIADDIINGFQCSWCGTCFEEEHGYPVACESCWEEALDDVKKGKLKDVVRENGQIIMISGVQKALEAEL